MSHQIMLNSWFGSDPDQAAKKLAKVFRMSLEQSETVVDKLRDGQSWKFARKIAEPGVSPPESLRLHTEKRPVQSDCDDGQESAFHVEFHGFLALSAKGETDAAPGSA